MPGSIFAHHIPEQIKNLLGTGSKVCVVNGSTIYNNLADTPFIIMACNTQDKTCHPGHHACR